MTDPVAAILQPVGADLTASLNATLKQAAAALQVKADRVVLLAYIMAGASVFNLLLAAAILWRQ